MEYKNNCIDSIIPAYPFESVTIGTQTWTKENLNYSDGGVDILTANASYNGINFDTQYYYTWDAAVRVASKFPGWHLPSLEEFNTLITYCGGSIVAGKKLKSTSGWNNNGNGTDDYGFTELPVGYIQDSSISYLTYGAYCWSCTESGQGALYLDLYSRRDAAYMYDHVKTYHYPVRLVKDS